MKVALFVHCFFPTHYYGTETYTLELATNLRALGHDVTVVSAVFPGEPGQQRVVGRYDYRGVPVYSIDKNFYPYVRIRDTYYQPQLYGTYYDLLRKLQPDIVHVTHLSNHTGILLEVIHDQQLAAIATLTDFYGICYNSKLHDANDHLCKGPNPQRTNCIACRLKDEAAFPQVGRIRRSIGTYPLTRVTGRLVRYAARFWGETDPRTQWMKDMTDRPEVMRALYANYRAVISPTYFLSKVYVANGFSGPVHTMRFGIDCGRDPKPARASKAPLRIGYIGQIAPHKGVDILLDAFIRLPTSPVELHIYGNEEQVPQYAAGLKERAVGFPVYFKGTFPKEVMDSVFVDLDYLVIPSRWYENSPLVLLNALASHTPVIVADVEGMTEFVSQGVNGFIFKRGSADALQRVLLTATAQPELARKMSSQTEYPRTVRAMTEDVVAVYREVGQGA